MARETEKLEEMVQLLDGRLHEVEVQMEGLETEKKKLQTNVQDLEDQ